MSINTIFLKPKTDIGGFKLDGVVSESHKETLVKTKHPVETGSDITDHSYVEVPQLVITGRVTDSPLLTSSASLNDFVDNVAAAFGAFNTDGDGRSQRAYRQLVAMLASGEPMVVSTNLRTYSDMVIVGLRNVQNKDNPKTLDIEISMEGFEFVSSSLLTVQVSETEEGKVRNQSAEATNRGRQLTPELDDISNASALKTISDFLGIGL